MNILVTGGAGYIGSHTCKALAKAGYTPVTYDNLVYGHEWAVKWGPLEIGDIGDRTRLDQVIQEYQPGAIMHFAAYAYVGESVNMPLEYYRNNMAGTLTLLEAARDNDIGKFVFSSTCATYGEPIEVPISEGHSQNPINPYGASKLMVEQMLADTADAYGLNSIALRYFNAAGADPEAEIGEDHDPETHLIPLVLHATQREDHPLTIFGNDYDTPDGTCVRDYIHVTDLAQAHVLALQSLEDVLVPSFRAFNLGNGKGVSVKEVIRMVEKVTARSIPVHMGPRRAGDPPVLIGSAEKAIHELGWQPEYADLGKIIETAWRWHCEL